MNIWQLGLDTGAFPFHILGSPEAWISPGIELDLMTIDDQAVVVPRVGGRPQRLAPARRDAELRLPRAGVADWVRISAIDDARIWVEFLPMASTIRPERGWQFVVHDYVLDDLRGDHKVPPGLAMDWLANKFTDTRGPKSRLVAIAGPSGLNPQAFGLLGDGYILDVQRSGNRVVAHRLSQARRARGELHGLETDVSFVTRFDLDDDSPAGDSGLLVGQHDSPLQDAYRRWLDVEVAQFARQSANLQVLAVEEVGDGRATIRVIPDASGEGTNGAQADRSRSNTRIGVGPRGNVEAALHRLREAVDLDAASDDLLQRLQALREPLTDHVVRPNGELQSIGKPAARGILAGIALDVGSLQQLERRVKALRRAKISTDGVPLLTLANGASSRRPSPRPTMLRASDVREAFRGEPTDSQYHALQIALNTPDVAVIQGPPGTGKTRLLTALRHVLTAEQHKRGGSPILLLTGPQHDAVDNLAEAGMTETRMPSARLGSRRADEEDDVERDPYGNEATAQWAAATAARIQSSFQPSSLATVIRRLKFIESAISIGGARQVEVHRQELLSLARDHSADSYRALTVALPSALPRAQPRGLDQVVRRIRTDEVAFMDDGAYVLRKLRGDRSFDSLLRHADERSLLDRLCGEGVEPSPADLDALADLKADLLSRIGSGETLGIRKDLAQAVAGVISAVEAKRQGSVEDVGDAVAEFRESLINDPNAVWDSVRHYADAYAMTCGFAGAEKVNEEFPQSGFPEIDGVTHVGVETVVIDEAARANPLDVLIAAHRAVKRVVLVGDQMQLPPLLEPESLESLSERERNLVSTPLFAALFDRLTELRASDGISRVATLTEQFRMHPRIGTFISDTFYRANGVDLINMRPLGDFPLRVEPFGVAVARWVDVPAASGAEQGSPSKWRQAELAAAVTVVKQLRAANANLSIGVIAFYAEQARRLQEALGWPFFDPAGDWLWVGTVDGSQGREFDVVVISTVRSARARNRGTSTARFGHLVNPNRLNVGMSRARRLLVMVGDREYLTGDADRCVPELVAFSAFADDEQRRG
jgi:hypothetical protein